MENYLNVSEFIGLIWVYTNFFGKGNVICLLTQSAFTRMITDWRNRFSTWIEKEELTLSLRGGPFSNLDYKIKKNFINLF